MYRIMLTDDEGIVLNSLTFLVEKNFEGQFEIETAKSGRAAIETAEHFRPDIIFMDIQMPGINGIDAMREIREFLPGVIFIVLTAYDKFDYAKEAINLGVMEYINKPFNQQAIVDVINQAVKELDLRREKRRNELRTKERLETVVPIIENGFVFSIGGLVRGNCSYARSILDLIRRDIEIGRSIHPLDRQRGREERGAVLINKPERYLDQLMPEGHQYVGRRKNRLSLCRVSGHQVVIRRSVGLIGQGNGICEVAYRGGVRVICRERNQRFVARKFQRRGRGEGCYCSR